MFTNLWAIVLELSENCDDYQYIITVENAQDFFDTTIKHYYQKKGGDRVLFHKSEPYTLVDAICKKNTKAELFLIFTETCSGNACPENIFGVFDLQQKKMLLTPKDWTVNNDKEVKKLTGIEPDYDEFHKNSVFCCTDKIIEAERKNKLIN